MINVNGFDFNFAEAFSKLVELLLLCLKFILEV